MIKRYINTFRFALTCSNYRDCSCDRCVGFVYAIDL